VTAQWQLFTADWGTQIADPQLANAWYTEALARAQAFDAATDWTTQRTTLSSAWVALGNAYRGANIPPPSDPEYRRIFREWFGKCETEPEFRRNYKVGALVSAGGGRRLAQIVARIWHDAKGDGNGQAGMIPVRLSLSSDGVVKSVCLEATGTGDCDYRGLYTGCATPAPEGIYQEHPCASVNYDANTFEWKSTEFGSASEFSMERCNVPLSVFRSVLNDLLDAWQSRGGAAGVIDQTRAFVAATNFGNAAAMGLAPAEYLTASHSAVIEAEQLSTGSNPARQTVASIMGAIATACAASANPYGAACAVVAAAIAALAQIIPVAAGIVTDQFGVPVGGDNRDAFLPAMIHGPNEGARTVRQAMQGFDVPDPPSLSSTSRATYADTAVPGSLGPSLGGGGTLGTGPALRVGGAAAAALAGVRPTAAAIASAQHLSLPRPTYSIVPPRSNQQSSGRGGLLAAAAAAAVIYVIAKGAR
jgi:hypothetical protein